MLYGAVSHYSVAELQPFLLKQLSNDMICNSSRMKSYELLTAIIRTFDCYHTVFNGYF